MTTIKSRCPKCGEVELAAEDILLRLRPVRNTSDYTFVCPKCRDDVTKPADDHVVRLLLSGGVFPTAENIPAEARERHDGPPLTVDDLIDLGLDLRKL